MAMVFWKPSKYYEMPDWHIVLVKKFNIDVFYGSLALYKANFKLPEYIKTKKWQILSCSDFVPAVALYE